LDLHHATKPIRLILKLNFIVITPQNTDASSKTMAKLYNFMNEVVTPMAEDSVRL
jgi:hypothetical protein